MKKFFIKLSAQIAMISLLFCVVVGSFILVDFLRFSALESPAESKLADIKTQITASPDNIELKELFADLELIYRRAYFVTDTQITEGTSLLLFGVGVFLLSLALRAYFLQSLPKMPEKDLVKKEDRADDVFIKILLSAVAISVLASVGVLLKQVLPSSTEELDVELPLVAYSTQAELDLNWTALRGSRNDGIARNFVLPENPKLSQLWEADLDIEGFNSVVQFGDIMYLSGARGEARVVKAFNINTGEQLWENVLDKQVDTNYDDQTGAAPSTMACDAHRAYAIFPSGELVAYTNQGKLAWQKKFAVPEISYGYASSLLVVENALIIQMTLDESNIVYALDVTNGKELWKCENDEHSASWSSPTLVEYESKKIIMVLSSAEVVAIDFASGEILWKNDCMGGEVAPSVSYLDGKVFVANENVAAFAFDVLTGEILWENSSVVLPSISSITVDKNAIYIYASGGTLTRLNTADGEAISEIDVDEGFNSSPILLGDRVFACDMAGAIFITKSNEDVAESVYDLGEPVNATPAFVGDKVLLRLEAKILCLKVEEAL